MKAIIVYFEGDTDSNGISNMIKALVNSEGTKIECDKVRVDVLSDKEVANAIILSTDVNKKRTREMRLHSFCKDVIGTCGNVLNPMDETFKKRFIGWMITDEHAYSSEIVRSLMKPTKTDIAVLKQYNLEKIPEYLEIILNL